MEEKRYTLGKSERLCSKKLVERLFAGGNKSFPAFPLRVVYMPLDIEDEGAEVSILVSVPKKRFKRAVKRNLVKRQVREAIAVTNIFYWMHYANRRIRREWRLHLFGWILVFIPVMRWNIR